MISEEKQRSIFDLGKPFEEQVKKYVCRGCRTQMCLGSCEILPNSTDEAGIFASSATPAGSFTVPRLSDTGGVDE